MKHVRPLLVTMLVGMCALAATEFAAARPPVSCHADPKLAATLPHANEVQTLIARLGRTNNDWRRPAFDPSKAPTPETLPAFRALMDEQQRIFDQLEALGPTSVPAIIAQMDDRRVLRVRAISLVNHSPHPFEGSRLYSPVQVVDGLDALLEQMTGHHGSIDSGGSDRQRDAAVASWRLYAANLGCRRR